MEEGRRLSLARRGRFPERGGRESRRLNVRDGQRLRRRRKPRSKARGALPLINRYRSKKRFYFGRIERRARHGAGCGKIASVDLWGPGFRPEIIRPVAIFE